MRVCVCVCVCVCVGGECVCGMVLFMQLPRNIPFPVVRVMNLLTCQLSKFSGEFLIVNMQLLIQWVHGGVKG